MDKNIYDCIMIDKDIYDIIHENFNISRFALRPVGEEDSKDKRIHMLYKGDLINQFTYQDASILPATESLKEEYADVEDFYCIIFKAGESIASS